jgi:uncharacterized membrane protein YdbT with pleckstrin-like domain
MGNQKLLLETRPSWRYFFWHWVFFWLLIPVVVAVWQRNALVLRVYQDRVVLEKGILSKHIKELFISDIRTIDTQQSLLQRIFGIGNIMIATSGTSGYEDVALGLPDPLSIKDLVLQQRQTAEATAD